MLLDYECVCGNGIQIRVQYCPVQKDLGLVWCGLCEHCNKWSIIDFASATEEEVMEHRADGFRMMKTLEGELTTAPKTAIDESKSKKKKVDQLGLQFGE